MAESNIEWTHFTFNTWWGCSKVSAGCKNCYAEALDARFKGDHWGDKAERRFFDDKHWAQPLKWNRKAEKDGVRYRVFCASMGDVFEIHPVPEENAKLDAARHRLWKLIEATPHLDWLLLTKRPENHELVPLAWQTGSRRPPNVWLGVTAENQEQADIRIPILLEAKWPAVRFVSYEPALGPIDLEAFVCDRSGEPAEGFPYWPQKENHGLDWIICGGESGPGRREMNIDWVRMMRAQCWWSEIPFFFKQKVEGGKKISLPLLDGVRHAAFPTPRKLTRDDESVFLRPAAPDVTSCDVCTWPTEGLAKRLVQAMRDRHPAGVNTCIDCVSRAKEDADKARGIR